MMHTLTTTVGGLIIGGAALLATNPLFVEPPFLKVVEINQIGENVHVARFVSGEKTIADWRVTIVGQEKDAPYCQTLPGSKKHEGWSPYDPGLQDSQMSLDEWVGDVGCFERLTSGEYIEITTWTPRDGRGPVTHRRTFWRE